MPPPDANDKSTGAPGTAGAPEVTDAAVRKIAKLSRLALDDEAIHRAGDQLRSVLGYIDRLREIDLEGVEPSAHPLDVVNRMDDDTPRPGLPVEALMKMAPETAGAFVRVPKVLGEEGGA